MILDRKEKQPVEIKDYIINYGEWLDEVNDTLTDAQASYICVSHPGDTSLLISRVVMAPKAVAVWLSGGTDGRRFKVSVTVTTAGGRRDQSEFIVRIKEH